MPFLGGKTGFFLWKKNKERKGIPPKKTNEEGLGPSEVAFGPPHLNLKPSKKKNPKKQKQNKNK